MKKSTPGPWIVVSSWQGHTRTDAYVHRKRADDLAAWHNRQSGHSSVVVSAKEAASAPALLAALEKMLLREGLEELGAPASDTRWKEVANASEEAIAALAAAKGSA